MTEGYKNPALAMLGIKSIKLPSRNWLIFWTVLSGLSGGIIYDKWQQRILRNQYMEKFNNQNISYPVDHKVRKLKIFIAPPPNDYLDESMKYFRRFVKPIINSSGLDYELITMERQGDIRFKVAEEIRQIRRSLIKKDIPEIVPVVDEIIPITTPKETKSVRDLYNPMDLLGIEKIFGNFKDKKIINDDSIVNDVRNSGGIICIGRGAYKEYINGIHEGLLGPLDKPEVEKIEKIEELDKDKEKDTEDSDDDKYAPSAFIYAKDYSNATFAPEFGIDLNDNIDNIRNKLRDNNDTPYFFTQPILELRNYNTSGFTKQFERMWRFYNKRNQLIEYNENLSKLINCNYCNFTNDKLNQGIEEENDWPSSWLKTAKINNSEWVREFKGDDRIMKILSSYNCK